MNSTCLIGRYSGLKVEWQQGHERLQPNDFEQVLQKTFQHDPVHFMSSQLTSQQKEHSNSCKFYLFFMQVLALMHCTFAYYAFINIKEQFKPNLKHSYICPSNNQILLKSANSLQYLCLGNKKVKIIFEIQSFDDYLYCKQIQLMRRRSYQVESISPQKYKYSFNDKTYDLNVGSSFDSRIGAYRAKQNTVVVQQKIKSNSNFTLQKLLGKNKLDNEVNKRHSKSIKHQLKLPSLKKKDENPQVKNGSTVNVNHSYYISRTAKSFDPKQNGYLVALTRQHFQQTVQALRIGKTLKPAVPRQIKLAKKNPKLKTVYLDLDETLIHCDEMSNNYTVKLDFPVQGGTTISAGIRVRPHCIEFLKELSNLAEIIIFTASSPSYADVVLDYLDPQKKYFSHRLYRQHCTLQKGYYTKDLRYSVLVDNSGFSFMLQPQNGIAILPYYHFNKDRQLLSLLQFLRQVLRYDDVRQKLKQYFFWHRYINNDGQVKKIFLENYNREQR